MTTLPDAWTPLRYHPEQTRLWKCKSRFTAVVAGRGSGKTELSRRRVVAMLAVRKPWPDPIYFFALPTYNQAKRVAWEPIKRLIPPSWIKPGGISESDLVIETVFGSKLFLLGLDKPARVEGVQWDGGVIDESSDQRMGVFDRSFLPAFSHREAWCWRIGVPKRFGIGAREFKAFYDRGLTGKEPEIASFTWKSGDIIPAKALELARSTLSDVDFAEQYESSWEQAGGRIFHAFGDHNKGPCSYDPERTIYVGSDFNVDPMAWTLSHIRMGPRNRGDFVETFDEVFLRDSNTPATMSYLWNKYGPHHRADWVFMGDASGRGRRTAATVTDYSIIRSDERFERKRVLYPKANPAVQDRFAVCNAAFRAASGVVRFRVDPRCTHLITDLENRSYKEGTREPDDVGDVSHSSDALGYILHPMLGHLIQPIRKAPAVFAA